MKREKGEEQNLYKVEIKLSESECRHCSRAYDSNPCEYIEHVAFGWYAVRVFAEDKTDAIRRAKEKLALYKGVKLEDFFENYRPIARGFNIAMTCPECGRSYSTWSDLDYDLCPICMRRCK